MSWINSSILASRSFISNGVSPIVVSFDTIEAALGQGQCDSGDDNDVNLSIELNLMTQSAVSNIRLIACLRSLGVPQGGSEVHGLVTGLLAAGSKMKAPLVLDTLAEWLETSIEGAEQAVLLQLYEEIVVSLQDAELSFEPLLPDDDDPVAERTLALGQWCSGFLAGFGLAGRFGDADLGEDLRELLSDLGKIAALDDEIPDDEDNETDLVEIVEYVRMSAMLIFTECVARAIH